MGLTRRDTLRALAAAFCGSLSPGFPTAWAQPGDTKRRGLALHIGLNRVNPAKYGNWSGVLKGCENDAKVYESIAKQHQFQTLRLLTNQATIPAVAQHILGAAELLQAGDIFLITYAGHGGQLPDKGNDEADRRDETWCLYDGEMRDDELFRFWQTFRKGVRIVMFSDSCHSGTVARVLRRSSEMTDELEDPDSPTSRAIDAGYGNKSDAIKDDVLARTSRAASRHRSRSRDMLEPPTAEEEADINEASVLFRGMPEDQILPAYESRKAYYDSIGQSLRAQGANRGDDMDASLLLISGCQDHQLSMEAGSNGLFTANFRTVMGKAPTSYSELKDWISRQMPYNQQPNLLHLGVRDDKFYEGEAPFTV